jgi:23S rRNA (guanosine2251-2'-O)-methyltransferase
MRHDIVLILHNIRSAHNVGSMFRTADGAGVSRIFLSGYTQAPAEDGRRMLREGEAALRKTALGAEYAVPWEWTDDLPHLLVRLKKDGFTIVSLECGVGGTDIREYHPEGGLALLVGHETEGIAPEILATSDAIVEIPMAGAKESLNVSVAAGIALFWLGQVQ